MNVKDICEYLKEKGFEYVLDLLKHIYEDRYNQLPEYIRKQKTLEQYLLPSYGLGPTQEDIMLISMDEKISGFDVKTSNLLRKSISKKDKALQHFLQLSRTEGKGTLCSCLPRIQP